MVRVARGIQFLKPGPAQDIGGEVKKTEVAESGFGDGIHDAAEELDGPFDARRRRLPFGETGEKDNIALVHPPDSGMGSACR